MKKRVEPQIIFDETMLELFVEMKGMQDAHELKRINSVMLLKGLLEEKDSILYDFLCSTSQMNNPYKQIIMDCDEALEKMKEKEEDIGEEEKVFSLYNPNGETISEYYLTETVKKILSDTITALRDMKLEELKEASKETSEEAEEGEELEITVTSEDIFVELIHNIPKKVLTILKNNGVYIEAILEYYNLLVEIYDPIDAEVANGSTEKEKIPKGISDFVTALSAKYKGVKECEILGRDKECQAVMQKRGRKNVILVGEPGVGKTAIAEKIAFDIANGNCPEVLKDKTILQLNVTSAIAGTMYRGMAEERFKLLVDFLEKNEDVILFIDEIHMVIGAGAISGNQEGSMANALKPFLASKKAMVIGTTTTKEYEKIIASDGAFERRFQKIVVKEPKAKEVYPMLKNAIKEHEKYHGVTISEEMVQYAVLMSACFNYTTRNPDRTNDLIDVSMVIAKQNGKKEVDGESILQKFDINFKKYHSMSEQSKLETAYHESGHYLVWRFSKVKKDYKGIAVSIMPAEDYIGVTVYDDISDEVTVNQDKEYYLANIASDLAGREAEKLYTNVISAKAREDLQKANKKAYHMVCELGMSSEDENVTYVDDFGHHMMSERIRDYIDEERKKIINKATEMARDILNTHRELLDKLAYSLLEKGILDENDLEEIFSK